MANGKPHIIPINARPDNPFDAYKRVAVYCRISSNSRAQLDSLSHQVSSLIQFVAQQGLWTLVDAYIDVRSGSSADSRPEFQRMMTDAASNKFNIILCRTVMRFGRNLPEMLTAVRDLKNMGIEVIFLNEDIHSLDAETELWLSLTGALAEADNDSRRKNIQWGILRKIENGTSVIYSRPCYGYQREGDKLVIIPEQAEVVRLVFELYLSGESILGIIAALKERGILSPTGKPVWPKHTLETLLRNDKYIGDITVFKTYQVGYPDTTRVTNDGSHKMFRMADGCPPIISRDVFERTQQEIQQRSNVVIEGNVRKRKNSRYSSAKSKSEGGLQKNESEVPYPQK